MSRPVTPLGHIILIPSQPVFSFTLQYCPLSKLLTLEVKLKTQVSKLQAPGCLQFSMQIIRYNVPELQTNSTICKINKVLIQQSLLFLIFIVYFLYYHSSIHYSRNNIIYLLFSGEYKMAEIQSFTVERTIYWLIHYQCS